MTAVYTLWLSVATFLLYLGSRVLRFYIDAYRLREIPTLGSSWPFSYRFLTNGKEMLQEGYLTYPGSAFKIAQFTRWTVFISGHDMVEDIRRATDNQLSFREAVQENLQLKNVLPKTYFRSSYQIQVVRGPLTRNIGARFPEVRDEIVTAFTEEIPVQSEWVQIPLLTVIRRVVSRTSNRLFVGLPLCRNPEYMKLTIGVAVSIFATSRILLTFPPFLRPLIARVLNTVPSRIKLALKLVGPQIQERLEMEKHHGPQWEGRPNDLLSWLLDEAPPEQKTVYDLTLRVLTANLAAITTTSSTSANTILYLAAYPEYVEPLRKEIQSVIESEGWSKASVGKMHKLDSFIKEVSRISGGISASSLERRTLKEFTFASNGLTVPAGTFISAAAYATHLDEAYYDSPNEFKPFRFADAQQHMVTPTHEYLFFGNGRHACPGRFFAVNEIKLIMAHLLLSYDMKLEGDEKVLPKVRWFGPGRILDDKARILFRKRK